MFGHEPPTQRLSTTAVRRPDCAICQAISLRPPRCRGREFPTALIQACASRLLAAHAACVYWCDLDNKRRDDDGEICAILRSLILARIASRRCRKTSLPRRRRRDCSRRLLFVRRSALASLLLHWNSSSQTGSTSSRE